MLTQDTRCVERERNGCVGRDRDCVVYKISPWILWLFLKTTGKEFFLIFMLEVCGIGANIYIKHCWYSIKVYNSYRVVKVLHILTQTGNGRSALPVLFVYCSYTQISQNFIAIRIINSMHKNLIWRNQTIRIKTKVIYVASIYYVLIHFKCALLQHGHTQDF